MYLYALCLYALPVSVLVCVCVALVGLTSGGAVGLCTLVRERQKEKETVRKQERQRVGGLWGLIVLHDCGPL